MYVKIDNTYYIKCISKFLYTYMESNSFTHTSLLFFPCVVEIIWFAWFKNTHLKSINIFFNKRIIFGRIGDSLQPVLNPSPLVKSKSEKKSILIRCFLHWTLLSLEAENEGENLDWIFCFKLEDVICFQGKGKKC